MSQSGTAAASSLQTDSQHSPPLFSIIHANRLTLAVEVTQEKVQDGRTGEIRDMAMARDAIIGNGSFAVVFHSRIFPNNEDVAIKRVLQDKRFKVLDLRPLYF